ncbi:hypothetical protein EGR_02573 [Echinococcus granulosus]|uniref:Uncharacterized protein n=1 Tax=Echinococcus granulosus TaxID=6210 RepID=W6UNW9_ECHGR|nr:hypothetical protein EGR_02573 [Echinococcus granulosus]EUB62441.1 hypothetical protein EGR_02573 [Echinococcus granulosus]
MCPLDTFACEQFKEEMSINNTVLLQGQIYLVNNNLKESCLACSKKKTLNNAEFPPLSPKCIFSPRKHYDRIQCSIAAIYHSSQFINYLNLRMFTLASNVFVAKGLPQLKFFIYLYFKGKALKNMVFNFKDAMSQFILLFLQSQLLLFLSYGEFKWIVTPVYQFYVEMASMNTCQNTTRKSLPSASTMLYRRYLELKDRSMDKAEASHELSTSFDCKCINEAPQNLQILQWNYRAEGNNINAYQASFTQLRIISLYQLFERDEIRSLWPFLEITKHRIYLICNKKFYIKMDKSSS